MNEQNPRIAISKQVRELTAELEILERYDRERFYRYGDYGNGQRHGELSRRRRELAATIERVERELDATIEDHETTPAELARAFERIGRPRIKRIEREDYRRTTKATEATLAAWRAVEKSVELAPVAGGSPELDSMSLAELGRLVEAGDKAAAAALLNREQAAADAIAELGDGALILWSDRQAAASPERAVAVQEIRRRGLSYKGFLTVEARQAMSDEVARRRRPIAGASTDDLEVLAREVPEIFAQRCEANARRRERADQERRDAAAELRELVAAGLAAGAGKVWLAEQLGVSRKHVHEIASAPLARWRAGEALGTLDLRAACHAAQREGDKKAERELASLVADREAKGETS